MAYGFNQDKIGEGLRLACGNFRQASEPGTAYAYVTAAGEAYRGGVFGDEEYAEVLAEVWRHLRACYLTARPKPTIAELETILATEGQGAISILPDGSIETTHPIVKG